LTKTYNPLWTYTLDYGHTHDMALDPVNSEYLAFNLQSTLTLGA